MHARKSRLPEHGNVVRAAVVGYGAYGRLHAQKYFEHPAVRLTSVVDTDASRLREAERDFPGVTALTDVRDLAGHADLASVVVPATYHYTVGRQLLEAGLHLLMEKPLATSPTDARALSDISERLQLIVQPGHLERFNRVLTALRSHLPAPRYLEARRLTQWRGRGVDVNVVFDLMIHDIDMLLETVDAPITHIQAHGVKVFSPHWDVASARLFFANGCMATLTASRASPVPERRLHVFSNHACALVDIDAGMMLLHRKSEQEPGVLTEQRSYPHQDFLAAEIAAFVHAVLTGRSPTVSAEDGCRAVEVAAHISDAMEQDANVLERIAVPLTDSRQAIDYLLRNEQHGHA